VVQKRLKDASKPGFVTPDDLIQLVMDTVKGDKGKDVDFQATAQIGTCRAALFTTASTVTHMMYDLASRPEYIEPLREEIFALSDVPMNRSNMAKLRKMDSFIRECQRFALFMLSRWRNGLISQLMPNSTYFSLSPPPPPPHSSPSVPLLRDI
jgi:cytochrome P450